MKKKMRKKITEASFPGGAQAWKEYLSRNLKKTLPGTPIGSYTVSVQFTIDKDGHHSGYKALSKLGHGMEEEALRIIKESPKQWTPALKNGNPVSSTYTAYVSYFIDRPSEGVATAQEIQEPKSNYSPPTISIKDLQKVTPEFLARVNLQKIVSFKYTTDNKEGTVYEAANTGNTFSEATKKLIGNAEVGNTIIIDEIYLLINGEKKKSPSQVYQITN
jgi:hypothetical protein